MGWEEGGGGTCSGHTEGGEVGRGQMRHSPPPPPLLGPHLCVGDDHVGQRQLVHAQSHAVQLVRIHVEQQVTQRLLGNIPGGGGGGRAGSPRRYSGGTAQRRLLGIPYAGEGEVQLACLLPAQQAGKGGGHCVGNV